MVRSFSWLFFPWMTCVPPMPTRTWLHTGCYPLRRPGAGFPVPELPGAVRLVLELNPLSDGVDGLRGALTSGFGTAISIRRCCNARKARLRAHA